LLTSACAVITLAFWTIVAPLNDLIAFARTYGPRS
jgi:hypothetical protein